MAFHHGYTRADLKNLVYNHFDRWSLRAAHRVVTVCNAFVSDLDRCGVSRERVRILHNFANPHIRASEAELANLRRRLGVQPGRPVIIAVGRLSAEKAQEDLLRAAARVCGAKNAPPFQVLIVGDGPDRAKLERVSGELRLNDVVHFAGAQPAVGPWYDISDIFVLPSHSEGSPNVLFEALAARLPILATAAGGVPEIVTDGGNALVVKPGDIDGLADGMRRLLESPALRDQLRDSAGALIAKYSPEGYSRALLAEMESLLS
jgi:glycosyltransferase involved in cell wall biosynthesis